MKRDEERARKMWRDIGVAAMQHGPNTLHHHQPTPMYGGPGNGTASTLPSNPHWNQPGYRNSYSLPHPTSQNGVSERNGGSRGVDGGGGSRYQHYDVKPLSQAPSFPDISSASYNGNGYHHSHHNHHSHHLHQQQQPHHPAGHHGLKPPRPLSMYELSNGHHNGGSSSPQLHSLPPNFVPHQTRNGSGRSPPPLVIHNNSQHGMGPRSPVGHASEGVGGGRTLLQQPEELRDGKPNAHRRQSAMAEAEKIKQV
uniref:Uncharacterized protein n=1 Tax=Anopheles culicifacies TaxID=139723 RepID=A0A182MNL7_9DIPT